jgi:hypothetical protein
VKLVVVGGTIAFVGWLGLGPRGQSCAGETHHDHARITLRQYAYEAFPSWAVANPARACPDSLAELDLYMSHDEPIDPWGRRYTIVCGAAVPAGVKAAFGVRSAGPDQTWFTDDDLTSWE